MNVLTSTQETTCKRLLARWMKTPNLVEIAVDEVETDGAGGREQDKVGQYTAAEIRDAYDDAEQLYDAFCSEWGAQGGKYQLRLVLHDDNGKTIASNQKRKTFTFKPERPGSRTGSQGSAAGIEAVTGALTNGFTQVSKQNAALAKESRVLLLDGIERIERLKEERHTDTGALKGQITTLMVDKAKLELQLEHQKWLHENDRGNWLDAVVELGPYLAPMVNVVSGYLGVHVQAMHLDNVERARRLGVPLGQPAAQVNEPDDDEDLVDDDEELTTGQ